MAGLAKNDVFELLELKFNRSKEEIRNGNMKVVEDDARGEVSGLVFADGKRWGYTFRACTPGCLSLTLYTSQCI